MESVIINVLIYSVFAANSILTATNFILLEMNLPPSYFGDVLVVCHMVGTGLTLPGALVEFNQQLVEAVTLNFGWLVSNRDYFETPHDLDTLKPSLIGVGYRSISASTNMKTSIFVLSIMTKILLICSSTTLYFVKNKTRCG